VSLGISTGDDINSLPGIGTFIMVRHNFSVIERADQIMYADVIIARWLLDENTE